MKHESLILTITFFLITALCLATNFIPWDETPLEQTLWALPLGVGFILQLPFIMLVTIFTPDSVIIDYNLRATLIPLISATTYTAVLYSGIGLLQQSKKKNY